MWKINVELHTKRAPMLHTRTRKSYSHSNTNNTFNLIAMKHVYVNTWNVSLCVRQAGYVIISKENKPSQ